MYVLFEKVAVWSNFKNLLAIKKSFDGKSAKRIKTIESKTNHDVKAVEYFIREKLKIG